MVRPQDTNFLMSMMMRRTSIVGQAKRHQPGDDDDNDNNDNADDDDDNVDSSGRGTSPSHEVQDPEKPVDPRCSS